MSDFLYGVALNIKTDLRNKGILLTYYLLPIVFFLFMGLIFTSIIPNTEKTLIQSMTIFGISLGALLGAPFPLCDVYGSEIKKSYCVSKIPL